MQTEVRRMTATVLVPSHEAIHILKCGHCGTVTCEGVYDPEQFSHASTEHHLNDCPDCPNRAEILEGRVAVDGQAR